MFKHQLPLSLSLLTQAHTGACCALKTYTQLLGEVTSLEMSESGHYLLSGTKGNSNRLWDLRTLVRSQLGAPALIKSSEDDLLIICSEHFIKIPLKNRNVC